MEIKLNMIKTTNNGCYISDCNYIKGYDYSYHRTEINKLIFDGKIAKETYLKNWFFIEQYPIKIQTTKKESYNVRYEIKDKDIISEKRPLVIKYEDRNKYDEDVIDDYYEYEYDTRDIIIDCKFEIKVIFEVDKFTNPNKINYKTIQRYSFEDTEYVITNKDVSHQLFDSMIFPELLLHEKPCKFSSKQVYDITRQYIIDNMDSSVAKITSNYDFCFNVKKIIPLIEPEKFTYQNIFAKTKRQRSKIHYGVKEFKEIEVFEMTHDQSKYNNYSVIKEICANSENELKAKVDEFLENLIKLINKPLELCKHCNGTGYKDNIIKSK